MDLALLTLLGGLLALDGTSVGQIMVSRPLVAGVLTGWVVGDPAAGLLIGGMMEIYFISVFPVGGADFPEGGPPAVVAVAVGTSIPGAGGLALGMLLGFLWSRLGAASIRLLRKVNGRLVPDPSRLQVSEAGILRAHLGGMVLDFVRGSLLTGAGLLVGGWMVRELGDDWPLDLAATLGVLAVGACVAAGALVGTLGGWRKRALLFGAGVVGFLIGSMVL